MITFSFFKFILSLFVNSKKHIKVDIINIKNGFINLEFISTLKSIRFLSDI